MKISQKTRVITATALVSLASLQSSVLTYAQTFRGFDTIASSLTTNLAKYGNMIINILSILLGIVAAVRLIPIFIKRGKNEGQTSELLTDWGFTLIFVILGLQLVKIILF